MHDSAFRKRQPRRKSKPWRRPRTWDDWARYVLKVANIVAAQADRERVDPWAKRLHSMVVSARHADRLRRVPSKAVARAAPRNWTQWAEREMLRVAANLKDARRPPWDRWAKNKIVTLTIRRRWLASKETTSISEPSAS